MSSYVVSISYGRHLFEEGNGERERLLKCSQTLAHHHMVVFTHARDALKTDQASPSLTLHPSNSRARVCMLFDTFFRVYSLVRKAPQGTEIVISAQDPFATGIIGLLAARILGVRFMTQEHGDFFSGSYWKNESWSNRVWYYIGRMVVRHADRVRAVSLRVREHLITLGVPPSRIVLLPVFTDLSQFSKEEVSRPLKERYPQASCIVLSVARFVPQKDLTLLVRAFARANAGEKNAHLVLVGRGSEEKHLSLVIQESGVAECVALIPWSSDVPSLMQSADIYALSSCYEGWARVLPEAMASGLPIVTTDVGCVGEVFLPGKHGLSVPVGDESAFATALQTLIHDSVRRRAYGEQARTDVRQSIFAHPAEYFAAWADLYRFS